MKCAVSAAIACAFLSGCAGYKLTPIGVAEAQQAHTEAGQREGYIFHAPAPYLFGTLKEQGEDGDRPSDHYEFKIVYLPDHSRPFRFTRYEVLAKQDLNINFENGWMFTGADSETDSTAALTALVDLAKTAADLISPLGTGQGDNPPPPEFMLFKIESDEDGSPVLRRVEVRVKPQDGGGG